MTLDEAIKHCEAVAKDQEKLCKRYDDASGYTRSHNEDIRTTGAKRCGECAKEHRQLAEWLKDYKRLLEQEPCEDCISRQDAIFLANDLKQDMPDDERIADMVMAHNEGILEYQTQLSLLPSVTPQPKTGHREYNDIYDHYLCGNCKTVVMDYDNYCPNCGAKMVEPQESEVLHEDSN